MEEEGTTAKRGVRTAGDGLEWVSVRVWVGGLVVSFLGGW